MARRRSSRNAPVTMFIGDNGESLTYREMALRTFEPYRLEHEKNKLATMSENLKEVESGIAAFKLEIEAQEKVIAELETENGADTDETTVIEQ